MGRKGAGCGQAEDELESLRTKHQKQVNAMSKQAKVQVGVCCPTILAGARRVPRGRGEVESGSPEELGCSFTAHGGQRRFADAFLHSHAGFQD